MAKMLRFMSNSSRAAWQTCPRRWKLLDDGVQPVRQARPLSVGSFVHAGVAAYWLGIRDGSGCLHDLAAAAVAREARKRTEALTARAANDPGIEQALAELAEHADVARDVCERYVDRHATKDRARYRVIAVEEPFQVLIPSEKGNPTSLVYTGRMDRLLLDLESGRVVVGETKTTRLRHAADLMGGQVFDGQPVGYCWAAGAVWALRQDGTGLRLDADDGQGAALLASGGAQRVTPTEVLYDVIRSKRPSEPKVNKDGTVSAAKDTDTTIVQWRTALATASKPCDPYDPKYLEITQRLERETVDGTWFHREIWPVTTGDVLDWLADVQMLRKAYGKPPYVRNVSACNALARPCPMRGVCLHHGDADNLPVGYVRTSKPAGVPVELYEDQDDVDDAQHAPF